MSMRPAVVFILITMMIDAMGIGLMIPVMPDLIAEVGAANLGPAASGVARWFLSRWGSGLWTTL